MREIKFRAWHKKKEEMIYDVQKTEIVHHAMTSMAGEASGLDHYFDEEWFELMQYTGLKDKNGQEIYEGDIFKDELWWVGEATVEHANGMFGFEGGDNKNPNFIPIIECKHIEVIGNIFEGVDK